MRFSAALGLFLGASLTRCFSVDEQQPIRPGKELKFPAVDSQSSPPPYRKDLLALHKALVDISSITGTENDVGNFLVDYFNDHAWSTKTEPLPSRDNTPPGKGRFNVLAWPGSSHRPHPKLLVTSHIDVVPPYIAYSISDDEPSGDTIIKGRGSVDAKASIAAQVTAVTELLDGGDLDPEDLMMLFVVGEEVNGDGMRHFSSTLEELDQPLNFKAVIFGEPTENKLACGHKGHTICTVTAKGKAGHSGYPWLGKSATELLIRGLVSVLDTDLGSSNRFGNTTVNIGTIEGGVAANVIPENASARVAVRVATGPQVAGDRPVRKAMAEALAAIDKEALRMDCENGYGAVDCDCEVDGFESITVNYGTDIPNLKGNHTRYLYGPGDILVAHSDHEQLTVGDLERAVEGYKKLVIHALKAE